MKTIKTRTKFKTEGRTFTDKTAAAFWEKLAHAKDEYETAKNKLFHLLATSFTTADGYPFEFGNTYYTVFEPWNSRPAILEVRGWSRNWDFDADEDSNDTDLVVYAFEDGWGHQRIKDPVKYKVRELYRDRTQANLAWLESYRCYLATATEDLREQEQRCHP